MARRIDLDGLLEDAAFLAEQKVGSTEAAHRLGFTNAKTLDKYLRRHGHNTLATRLARQDYEPLADRGPTRHQPLGRAS